MSFNQQLNRQLKELEKHEKNSAAKDSLPTFKLCEDGKLRPSNNLKTGRNRERVVGGDILWRPVDKTAALVVSKAPWWAQPPHTPTKKEKPMKSAVSTMTHDPHPMIGPAMQVHEKTNDEFNEGILKASNKRIKETIDSTHELVDKAQDAYAAMDVLTNSFKKSWAEFQDTCSARITEMRMAKMATETETRQLMSAMREVRQFFLGEDHTKEVQRLKEFVELCERLKSLKESGFLDAVSDTILKIS